jgi:hypothetical protein
MTELETMTEAEVEGFTDDLSDEALDRGDASRFCVTGGGTYCGAPRRD